MNRLRCVHCACGVISVVMLLLPGCAVVPKAPEPTTAILRATASMNPCPAEAYSGIRIADLSMPYAQRRLVTYGDHDCAPTESSRGAGRYLDALLHAATVTASPPPASSQWTRPTARYSAADNPRRLVLRPELFAAALGSDIRTGQLAVATDGEAGVRLIVGGAATFRTGSARPRTALRALLRRIAQVAASTGAGLQVTGYTDARPIHSRRFPDNSALSAARAAAAGELLAAQLTAPQIVTEGRGADEPVAANTTSEGRARNRRIEILLRLPEAAP